MKTLQYHKNLPKLVTLISMGLASVPAESFKHNQLSFTPDIQYSFSSAQFNQFVAIPIDKATEKMNILAESINKHLIHLKEKWINPPHYFINEDDYYQINKSIKRLDNSLTDIKNILLSLPKSDTQKKQSVLLFGRSLAHYRSVLTEFISFIEQTHQPSKTTNKKPNIISADMQRLIQTEHKKLGLSKPKFNNH